MPDLTPVQAHAAIDKAITRLTGYGDNNTAYLAEVRDFVRQQHSALEQARHTCAQLYQVLGAHGASEKALDNCLAISEGRAPPHDDLLPYDATPGKMRNDISWFEEYQDLFKTEWTVDEILGVIRTIQHDAVDSCRQPVAMTEREKNAHYGAIVDQIAVNPKPDVFVEDQPDAPVGGMSEAELQSEAKKISSAWVAVDIGLARMLEVSIIALAKRYAASCAPQLTPRQRAADQLFNALKNLSFMAQTSGGVAGRDDDLMKAIEIAEQALAAAEGKNEKGNSP